MKFHYDIPQGWALVSLEELAAPEKGAIRIGPFGSALKKDELSDDGVRVLGIDHVHPNKLIWEKPKYIPLGKYEELRQYTVSDGDLLVTNMGTVGRTCVVPNGFPTAIISSHLIKVTVDRRKVNPQYLAWALNSSSFVVDQVQSKCQGAIMAGFNSSLLKSLDIPLPPLAEQKRIAEILDAAEALREKRRQAITKLDTLEQAIFVDMFGDPIENSKGFPVSPLIELVDEHRPITYGILKPGPHVDDGIRYVRVVDMKDGRIDTSEIRRTSSEISLSYKRSLLKEGDLLLSIRGHVGRLASVPRELEGANITQDTARLAIVGADAVFVRECLRTPAVQRWMSRHMKGVAVKGINLGDVKNMPIAVPPRNLQAKFVKLVGEFSVIASDQRRAFNEVSLMCTSLQQRAFVGRL